MQTMAPPAGEQEQRFARIDERIVDVGRRVSEVDRRVTELKEETNNRFDRVEGDLKDLKKSVESIQTTLARVGFGVALTFASVLITKGG
jgi:archaellum component FlaC